MVHFNITMLTVVDAALGYLLGLFYSYYADLEDRPGTRHASMLVTYMYVTLNILVSYCQLHTLFTSYKHIVYP